MKINNLRTLFGISGFLSHETIRHPV